MTIRQGLVKYQKQVAIKKTKTYQMLEKQKEWFDKYRIKVKIKDEYQLQDFLIGFYSFKNLEVLFQIYMYNRNENIDLWEAMNYQQRQILLSGQLHTKLEELLHFYIEDQLVLFPCFNIELNNRFILDYQSTLLKKNRESIEEALSHLLCATTLYGDDVLKCGFSDFIYIKTFEEISYFYLPEYRCLYLFDKINRVFVEKWPVMDKYSDRVLDKTVLSEICTLIHHQKEEVLLDYLLDHQCLNKKVYTKIKKKYLGG